MVPTNLFFLLLCSFICFTNTQFECPAANDVFSTAQIFVLYETIYLKTIKKQIVIYYYHEHWKPGDFIILVENNTLTKAFSYQRYTPTGRSGVIFTTVPVVNLTHKSISKFTTQFLGHCAYWKRDDIKSKTSCLTSHPQWMYDLRHYIGNRTLRNLLLPGTHQSGSYIQTKNHALVNQFAAAQDLTVLEQLIFGARYLDLRPASTNSEYYNSHGFIFMEKMQPIIDDIKEFLDNTQEIVIVSFKEFYKGFDTLQDHDDFADYLQTQFKEHLFPRPDKRWSITMDEIWNSNKRLIISYDHPIYISISFMWRRIPHTWGNVSPDGNLQNFIANAESDYKKPRVTVAAYTMQKSTILVNTLKYALRIKSLSLRDLAVSVGFNITQWYNELYKYSANIIAVDYIQSTGIVEVAIEWNKQLSSPCYISRLEI